MVVYQSIEFSHMTHFRFPSPHFNPFNAKVILVLLWLFLLVFPKGGIKIANVPLTWGYLFIGVTSLFVIFQGKWTVTASRTIAFLCLVPFLTIAAGSMMWNGENALGWVLAFWITFLFLPFVFLILISNQIENLDLNYFLKLLKTGILFVSYYGIFLFLFKQTTGKYLEIPFLTINAGDLGMLDDFKCNSRGIVSKLISTYNNGQLFGISMILLLPLYCYIQKNPWNLFVTKFALVLTLSRTTWIGLLLNEILFSLFVVKANKKSAIYLTAGIIVLVSVISLLLNYYDFSSLFLLDGNLGGRREMLEAALQECSLFSKRPFNGISEMTYMAMLYIFGIIGLITYIFAMTGPLVLCFSKRPSKIRTCILLGLVNYLIISFSDGATLYIPVLAFFWFLLSLLLRKNLDDPGMAERTLQDLMASKSDRITI